MTRGNYDSMSRIVFTMLPTVVLEWHVAYTLKQLTKLSKRVADIEHKIGSGFANYSDLGVELNRCNSTHLVLDRRWRFEIALAQHLLQYLEGIAKTHRKEYPPDCSQRVKLHLQLSEGLEYDLRVLPRRIELQQIAVSSLLVVVLFVHVAEM